MDVRNCRQCGRLFNYLSGPQICPGAEMLLEEKFQQVKEYVRSNHERPFRWYLRTMM